MDNQVIRVADREPLSAGFERRGDADSAGIGTTRFLGGEDGPCGRTPDLARRVLG